MLKPIVSAGPLVVSLDHLKAGIVEKAAVPIEVVNQVFKVLHGAYGSLFLAKFATGELDENGKDKGIKSTRQVWAHGLMGMDSKTITGALERVLEVHPEFPPTLPQFIALCKAAKPSQRPDELARLGVSGQAHSDATKGAREAALAKIGAVKKPRATESPLNELKSLVAQAVALAGGDEVKELMRLDALLAPKEQQA
jgi:hypothetical protein